MHILLVTVVGANSLVITCFNVLFMEGHWKGSFSEDSEGGMPSLLSMVTARTGSMRSPLYKAASEDGQSSMTKESRVQHDATPGNAIRLLQPAVSAPLGLQTAGDVFALDPILQILAFPLGQTSEGLTARQSGEEGLVGDVILHTPLHSYGLVNDRPTIIERMLFIPGTGTLLTYGVQERETCGEFSFEGVLQLWTFLEDVKPKAPRTIDLPFFVTSMIRNTFHPSSKWERTLLEQRLASTQRSDMVGSNEDTTSGESKAESLVDWYNPYPSGDPKDDSRWLVLLGTSEGDLRVFDAWSGSFTDFLITSQQVFSQITVPSLPEVMTTTDNPLVDVHVHPTSSQVVLLAYARGLVAEVHLVSTSVLDFYLPFSSRELKNVGDASVCQKTLCLPSATTSVGRLEVQAVHYQHRGRAILVSTVSANQTTEGLQPQLMVFARHKVNPILILDLDGLMGRSHSNCSLPFIHWHNKDLAPERQYDPSCIVKGSVYVLIRPRRLTAQERFHGQQLDADCPSNLIQFSGDCWTQVHGVFPSSKHQPDAVIQHCLTIPPHTIQAPYTCGFPTVASLGGLSLPPFRQDDSGDMVDLLRQSIAKLSRMLLSSCTILALTPFPFMQVLGTVVGIFNKKVDVMKGFYPQMSNWPAGFRSSRDDDVGDVECDEAGGCNAPKAFVSSWPAFSVSWSSMRMVGVSACDWYYRTVESKDSRFIKNRVVGFDKHVVEHLPPLRALLTAARTNTDLNTVITTSECSLPVEDSTMAFAAALLTARLRQVTNGWIESMGGNRSHQMTRHIDENNSEHEEWLSLNDRLGTGDLIRPLSFFNRISSVALPATLLTTGHVDGTVNIWLVNGASFVLLYTISAIAYFGPGSKVTSRCPCERSRLYTINSCHAKPIQPFWPTSTEISAVQLSMYATRKQRYLAVGFASGEVAVFRWQSEASELSPCEAEVGDVDPGLRVPFGISCVGRWKLGSQPIVFLATERCTTTLQPEVEGREGDYVSLMDIQKFCFDFRNTVSTTLPSKTTMCHRTLACDSTGRWLVVDIQANSATPLFVGRPFDSNRLPTHLSGLSSVIKCKGCVVLPMPIVFSEANINRNAFRTIEQAGSAVMVVGTESGELLQLHMGSGALLLGHKGSTVGNLSHFVQFDCSKIHGLFHVRGELKSWADMFTKTVTAAYDDPTNKAGVTEDSCPRMLRVSQFVSSFEHPDADKYSWHSRTHLVVVSQGSIMLLSLRGDSPGYAYTFPISAGFLSFTIQSPITDVNLIYVDNVPVVVMTTGSRVDLFAVLKLKDNKEMIVKYVGGFDTHGPLESKPTEPFRTFSSPDGNMVMVPERMGTPCRRTSFVPALSHPEIFADGDCAAFLRKALVAHSNRCKLRLGGRGRSGKLPRADAITLTGFRKQINNMTHNLKAATGMAKHREMPLRDIVAAATGARAEDLKRGRKPLEKVSWPVRKIASQTKPEGSPTRGIQKKIVSVREADTVVPRSTSLTRSGLFGRYE